MQFSRFIVSVCLWYQGNGGLAETTGMSGPGQHMVSRLLAAPEAACTAPQKTQCAQASPQPLGPPGLWFWSQVQSFFAQDLGGQQVSGRKVAHPANSVSRRGPSQTSISRPVRIGFIPSAQNTAPTLQSLLLWDPGGDLAITLHVQAPASCEGGDQLLWG